MWPTILRIGGAHTSAETSLQSTYGEFAPIYLHARCRRRGWIHTTHFWSNPTKPRLLIRMLPVEEHNMQNSPRGLLGFNSQSCGKLPYRIERDARNLTCNSLQFSCLAPPSTIIIFAGHVSSSVRFMEAVRRLYSLINLQSEKPTKSSW